MGSGIIIRFGFGEVCTGAFRTPVMTARLQDCGRRLQVIGRHEAATHRDGQGTSTTCSIPASYMVSVSAKCSIRIVDAG
jgi:hypothetical protein